MIALYYYRVLMSMVLWGGVLLPGVRLATGLSLQPGRKGKKGIHFVSVVKLT